MNQEQKINEDSKRCSTSNCSKDGKIFLCNECGFISGTKITGTYHMRKSHLGVSTTLDLFCHDCSVAATIKVNYINFLLFRKLSCSFKIVCLCGRLQRKMQLVQIRFSLWALELLTSEASPLATQFFQKGLQNPPQL